MSYLHVENITKNFGQVEVLKGISFDMEKGETRVITVKANEAFDTADIAVKTWLDEWDR